MERLTEKEGEIGTEGEKGKERMRERENLSFTSSPLKWTQQHGLSQVEAGSLQVHLGLFGPASTAFPDTQAGNRIGSMVAGTHSTLTQDASFSAAA